MKTLVFTLFAICLFQMAYAQDMIILKDGSDIKARVVEITPDYIKYRNFDHLDGPVITMKKSEAFLIKYENGLKMVFNTIEEQPVESAISNLPKPSPSDKSQETSQEQDYLFYGGVSLILGDFSFASTGFNIGLENTHLFNKSFGITGHLSATYNKIELYDYYWGTVSGGIINSYAMSGLRVGSGSEIVEFYALGLVGVDYAIANGDLGELIDSQGAFHFAVGGGVGFVFNKSFEIGARFHNIPEVGFSSLQLSAGIHF